MPRTPTPSTYTSHFSGIHFPFHFPGHFFTPSNPCVFCLIYSAAPGLFPVGAYRCNQECLTSMYLQIGTQSSVCVQTVNLQLKKVLPVYCYHHVKGVRHLIHLKWMSDASIYINSAFHTNVRLENIPTGHWTKLYGRHRHHEEFVAMASTSK